MLIIVIASPITHGPWLINTVDDCSHSTVKRRLGVSADALKFSRFSGGFPIYFWLVVAPSQTAIRQPTIPTSLGKNVGETTSHPSVFLVLLLMELQLLIMLLQNWWWKISTCSIYPHCLDSHHGSISGIYRCLYFDYYGLYDWYLKYGWVYAHKLHISADNQSCGCRMSVWFQTLFFNTK